MRLTFRVVCLVLLCATVFALIALAAIGSVQGRSGPERWPDGDITVFNASGWQRAVADAADRWNRQQLGVTLRLVDDARSADVVVLEDDDLRERCGQRCAGWASQIGYRPGGQAKVYLPSAGRLNDIMPSPGEVRLAMHELGHVLGLRHERGCQLMDPHLGACAHGQNLSCDLAAGDRLQAARLYGTTPRSRSSACPQLPRLRTSR